MAWKVGHGHGSLSHARGRARARAATSDDNLPDAPPLAHRAAQLHNQQAGAAAGGGDVTGSLEIGRLIWESWARLRGLEVQDQGEGEGADFAFHTLPPYTSGTVGRVRGTGNPRQDHLLLTV